MFKVLSLLACVDTWYSILAASSSLRDQSGSVRVALYHNLKKALLQDNLHALEFCTQHGCNPHLEGSRLLALGAVHGPTEYKAEGSLVYAVPNNAARILNRAQLKGQVALVHRGVIPLVDKVWAAQASGAVGVVIVDDGTCEGQYYCGPAGGLRDGGFSRNDSIDKWKGVTIPSLLVSLEEGERLREMMLLDKRKVPGTSEEQWVNRK